MADPLPPWRNQDNFKRSAHQRLVDRVNQQQVVNVDGGGAHNTPGGTSIIPGGGQPRPNVTVKITANDALGGQYVGIILEYHLEVKLEVGGDPQDLDIEGATEEGRECRIIDTHEDKEHGHRLAINSIHDGSVIGTDVENTLVVSIDGWECRTDGPVSPTVDLLTHVIGGFGYDPEDGTYTDPPAPLAYSAITNLEYDSELLRLIGRWTTFYTDACGKVISATLGGEVTIIQFTECPEEEGVAPGEFNSY